jgi:hypothetical protein
VSIWAVNRIVRGAERGLIRAAGNITNFILRRAAAYRSSGVVRFARAAAAGFDELGTSSPVRALKRFRHWMNS